MNVSKTITHSKLIKYLNYYYEFNLKETKKVGRIALKPRIIFRNKKYDPIGSKVIATTIRILQARSL